MKLRLALIILGGFAATIIGLGNATGRQNYETAGYEVRKAAGAFEIRAYGALAVASSGIAEASKQGMNSGFGRLFKYITGQNETESKIAMTTPVFVTSGDNRQQVMSFVLPEAVAESGAPKPSGGSVFLGEWKGGTFAVYRYSGYRSDERDAKALAKLKEWMVAAELTASPGSEPRYADYDPPWTLGPLRRNEVMVKIR